MLFRSAGLSLYIWLHRGINFTQAWQVLFFGGMTAGYYWRTLQAWVATWSEKAQKLAFRSIVTAAGVTVFISYLNLFVLDSLHSRLDSLTPWFSSFVWHWDRINEAFWPYFDKFTLEPGRIFMFLLWFAAAFLVVNRYSSKIPKRLSWGLNLFGQNSLYVYGLHSFVVFAVHAYLPKDWGLGFNFAVTAAVIAIMIGITHGKNVLKTKSITAGPFSLNNGRLALTRIGHS